MDFQLVSFNSMFKTIFFVIFILLLRTINIPHKLEILQFNKQAHYFDIQITDKLSKQKKLPKNGYKCKVIRSF